MSNDKVQPDQARQSSRFWRWTRRILLVLLVAILILYGGYRYRSHQIREKLEEAIVEQNRIESKWQRKDLEAERVSIPNDENGALVLQKLSRLLPAEWGGGYLPFVDLEPPRRLRTDQIQILRQELKKVTEARSLAKQLLMYERGRIPGTFFPGEFREKVPEEARSARNVAILLEAEAQLAVEGEKIDEALHCAHATLHAAKSIGDQPGSRSFYYRNSCDLIAMWIVERALAQGQPGTVKDLIEIQKDLNEEIKPERLVRAWKAERAELHEMLTGFARSDEWLSMAIVLGVELNWKRRNLPGHFHDEIRAAHAEMLPLSREVLALLAFPSHQFRAKMKTFFHKLEQRSPMTRNLLTGASRLSQSAEFLKARVGTARVAIALERYRLDHNKWPASLKELIPRYIDEIPLDPVDGKSLRYRPFEEGVVVYSIGDNEVDDSGDPGKDLVGGRPPDITFRLWDVKHRRQPPKPKPADPFEDFDPGEL